MPTSVTDKRETLRRAGLRGWNLPAAGRGAALPAKPKPVTAASAASSSCVTPSSCIVHNGPLDLLPLLARPHREVERPV